MSKVIDGCVVRGSDVSARRDASVVAAPVIDDGVMREVNRYALRGMAAEEVAVFTADVCSNQVDRHCSRFPAEELAKIVTLLPGKPLMERHDTRGALPRGTWFRAWLHEEGDLTTVRAQCYLLRSADNAEFIAQIEAGVYREISIGFAFRLPECSICGEDLRTCDHVPGRAYEGAVCHYVMRDVTDVLEASVVASGSQGVQFVSQEKSEPRMDTNGHEWGKKSQSGDWRSREEHPPPLGDSRHPLQRGTEGGFFVARSVLSRVAKGEGNPEEIDALRVMREALALALCEGEERTASQGTGGAGEEDLTQRRGGAEQIRRGFDGRTADGAGKPSRRAGEDAGRLPGGRGGAGTRLAGDRRNENEDYERRRMALLRRRIEG